MLQFEEQTFSCIKHKSIVIIGISKEAQLIRELLLFRECEISGYLNLYYDQEASEINGIPVWTLNDIIESHEKIILLSPIVITPEMKVCLAYAGYDIDDIYNVVEFTNGKIPEYLVDDAIKFLTLRGGLWEHCKNLFLNGIDVCHGAISKGISVDGVLTIEGWVLPRCAFENVQILVNGTFVGNAEIGRLRGDVKKKYPIFNDTNSGFFFETTYSAKKKNVVVAQAVHDDTIIWSFKRVITNWTLEEFVYDLVSKKEYEKPLSFMKSYMKCRDNSIKLRNVFDKILRESKDWRLNIGIYQLIYQLGLFNASYMEAYIKEIDQVDDVWTKLWLREQDIPWMLFYYPQNTFKSIYTWERAVMVQVAEELRVLKGMQRRANCPSECNNSVVILVEGLAGEMVASAIFEMEIANVLALKGYHVTILVLDSSYFENSLQTTSIVTRKRDSTVNSEYHYKTIKENVEICYCSEKSLKAKVWTAIDKIEDISPDFILDISLAGTVVAAMFHGQIPVIHIPLTGYSSGAVFDQYIAKSKFLCLRDNLVYGSVEKEKICEAAINIPYTHKQRKIYYRDELGFQQNDFILVTVGNRLKYEMDDEFISAVVELLGKDKRYKWIVVGDDLGEHFNEIVAELIESGQIRIWGFENDLIALYKICNAYLEPNRVGGCGSMELAMKLKLPIAITSFTSDILPIIGINNCCGDSYSDIVSYIEKLFSMPLFYRSESKKFYNILKHKNLTMKHYVNVIIAAYRKVR